MSQTKPARARNLLSAQQVKAAMPQAKAYKLRDGGGLQLLVQPNGSKLWQYRFELGGREKLHSIGSAAGVTLAEARAARDAAEKLAREGRDPLLARRQAKGAVIRAQGDTFGYFATIVSARIAASQGARTIECWRRDLGYAVERFGREPVRSIRRPEVLEWLRSFERLGTISVLHSVRRKMVAVFSEAIEAEACEANPAVFQNGRFRPERHKGHAAIVDPVGFGRLLRMIDDYAGQPSTRGLLKLSALLFQRPTELRQMRWSEINWDECLWEIPASRMKMKRPHIVPLSSQALHILRDLEALYGRREWVFPGIGSNGRSLSRATVNVALRAMGLAGDEMTGHGFRASANTLLKERVRFPEWIIDRNDCIQTQLAHQTGTAVTRAYDRAHLLEARRWLMQAWSDYCDEMRKGGEVIPIGGRPARAAG